MRKTARSTCLRRRWDRGTWARSLVPCPFSCNFPTSSPECDTFHRLSLTLSPPFLDPFTAFSRPFHRLSSTLPPPFLDPSTAFP